MPASPAHGLVVPNSTRLAIEDWVVLFVVIFLAVQMLKIFHENKFN